MEQTVFDIMMQTNNAKAKLNDNGDKIRLKKES
jgi:hypothetical protein